ncbi:glycosyltransferase family 4 protein [Haliea sp. E17]|uniref:glycosyltransferase family 4 protein n=1 Tax=Haliea sp. E17 TaxID=3401576 RepID=UPI003AAF818A
MTLPHTPQRILIAHNFYQFAGGEDSVVRSEAQLLEKHGHDVQLYSRHNDEIISTGKPKLAIETFWSRKTVNEIEQLIDNYKPDIIHAHNTFPLISGSLYWTAATRGIPVVQTIHNFRLMCIQAMFLREGKVCEDCLGKSPIRGVLRKCYRGSTSASLVAGSALSMHRWKGTYSKTISAYIALNEFCKQKLIEGGLPPNKIFVKPNFVDLDVYPGHRRTGNPLFVGRLSDEKGVTQLLAALDQSPGMIVDFAGDGPLKDVVIAHPQANYLGLLGTTSLQKTLLNAPFLLMPSIWYENMPRTLVEAYACGTPVFASKLGALAELIEQDVTGLLFSPGDSRDIASTLKYGVNNMARVRQLGANARRRYEASYTSAENYQSLANIYNQVTSQGVN